jgi:hypothetical protein
MSTTLFGGNLIIYNISINIFSKITKSYDRMIQMINTMTSKTKNTSGPPSIHFSNNISNMKRFFMLSLIY